MKKNVFLRAAVLMLVLTLMTSCFVGGTFARYTTSGTGTDSARVAAFGVDVTINGETFADHYGTTVVSRSEISTANGGISDVVAPGTNGNLNSIAVTGQPEVSVTMTFDATFDIGGWNLNGAGYYCPIVITVDTTDYHGMDYDSEAAFEAAVTAAIEGYTATYAPNTDLSAVNGASLGISWHWAFDETDTEYWKDGGNSHAYDTVLGDQAADGHAATISLTVTITVDQVD